MTIWTPNPKEVERLRLLLSTYQDGTGQYQIKGLGNIPGWRDFERSVAKAFGGEGGEDKSVFDVTLENLANPGTLVGLSCKMRGELDRVYRDGRVTIEVANSDGEFWDYLRTKGINQTNYRNHPSDVGKYILEVVSGWHFEPSLEAGGLVDLKYSSYFVLQWNRKGKFRLFQHILTMPNPETLDWSFPIPKNKEEGRALIGKSGDSRIIEWYGQSGGQLKYYPLATEAIWTSEIFELEPLPATVEHGIAAKAATYFPEKWFEASAE
jgi:hypothetical protein